MAWDFNRPMPQIAVYHTSAPLPKPWKARFYDVEINTKNGVTRETTYVWYIEFDASTHDAARDAAMAWWNEQAKKQMDLAVNAAARTAARAAARAINRAVS
jgi:hypothetical protein